MMTKDELFAKTNDELLELINQRKEKVFSCMQDVMLAQAILAEREGFETGKVPKAGKRL